jgi:hypothetical protein
MRPEEFEVNYKILIFVKIFDFLFSVKTHLKQFKIFFFVLKDFGK